MSKENQNATIIPEDIQIAMKLEAIFTPQLRQKREDAYKIQTKDRDDDKCARFVHYTTAEAALSIIQNKRIWMRKTTCMSDYREVEHGFDVLNTCFGDKSKFDAFSAALDSCAPLSGVAQESRKLFNQHLGSIRSSTYIASIAEHDAEEDLHGRLSMWRAFGGDTGRVAIVLKIPWYTEGLIKGVNALNIRFGPVAYIAENDFDNEFKKIINNIVASREFLCSVGYERVANSIFNMLLISTVCLKHSGFREEREWRVMYFPTMWSSPFMTSEIKVIGGVPQKIFKLPLDADIDDTLAQLDLPFMFERLIIGPTEYPWPMFEAFSDALATIGVQESHNKVFVSNIPIRT